MLMSYLKKEIEGHIERNGLAKVNQIGFCDGGRTEFNHFIILYLVERARRRGEEMFVIALDFKKAFDSINRIKLIETLIEYRVHPNIVDLIARLYSDDKTTDVVRYEERGVRELRDKTGVPFVDDIIQAGNIYDYKKTGGRGSGI